MTDETKNDCRWPRNGRELCPWCMTCGMADPIYLLNRKLKAEGQEEAAHSLGLEMAEFMMLLDKLFLLERREVADSLIGRSWRRTGRTWRQADRWSESSHSSEVAMNLLPHVVKAEYRGDHRIHLWFHDGREKTVDFAPWLRGPVFEPLKDVAYFRRFFLEAGTVTWPNGA